MDLMPGRDVAPRFGSTTSTAPLLIDRFVDDADATIAAHRIVTATPVTTFEPPAPSTCST